MIHRHVTVAALALAACGKSSKEPAPSEPKATEAAPVPQAKQAAADMPAPAPAQKPSRGPERPIYSLLDNRLSAHLERGGGLLVPAGSAGFAKYVRIGNVMKGAKRSWDLRQAEGDIKVAKLTGKSGSIFVPLTAAQAGHATVRLRAFAGDDGTVSLRVNDHKDINGKLTKGWSTVELTVPAGQLVEGENSLTLFGEASGVELAWLQVGAQAPVGDDGSVRLRSGDQEPDPAQGRRAQLLRRGPRQGAPDRRSRRCQVHGRRGRDHRRRPDRRGQARRAPAARSISPRSAARPRGSISRPAAARKPSSPAPRWSCPAMSRRSSAVRRPSSWCS